MWTTIAYSKSHDPGGAYARITPTPDQHSHIEGNMHIIEDFNELFGAMACLGTTGAQARFVAPSLRRHSLHYISPVELDIHPGAKVHIDIDPKTFLKLDTYEGLEVEENSDPTSDEQHAVIAWLKNSDITPVKGRIFTVHFTITLAQVVNSWESSNITLIEELPVGKYAVVGARFIADGGICARFVPRRNTHRPGAPCVLNVEEDGDEMFRRGNLGEWLTFDTNSPPQVELLGSAAVASTTYQCEMDLLIPV